MPAPDGADALGYSGQARPVQDCPVQARLVQEMMRALAQANVPFPPAGSAPEGQVVRSEREGLSFLLPGPVEGEVLEALLVRVR